MSAILRSFLLAIFCFAYNVNGQSIKFLYNTAENYFYAEDPHRAYTAYKRVATLDPTYRDVVYKLELSVLLQGDSERPLDKILAFRDTEGIEDKFYYYWLGRILDYRYQFKEAVLAWQQFLRIEGYKSQEIIDETNFFIENTRKKIEVFRSENRFQVMKLSEAINSNNSELTPTYIPSANQLLFASSRGNEEDIFNVFTIELNDNEWGTLEKLSSFGNFYENNANLMLVNEDGKLFMYRDHKGGDLYYSELRNENWTTPLEFDSKITNTHLGSHFYINEHEDRIVFASDKNFKKRGLDIYQSYKNIESGDWSKPAPFTEVINSEFDEDSPFLTTDEKTLYFSSTGHGSLGGYDVFMSEFDENTQSWSEPINLGFPINTPDDEIQFKISIEGDGGYFSSNRLKPLHDYDIYHFYEPEWTKIEGKIYDLVTKKAIDSGEIEFSNVGVGETKFTASIDASGAYKARVVAGKVYNISIENGGSVIHEDEFEVTSSEIATLHMKNFYTNGDLIDHEMTLAEQIRSDDPGRYQSYEKSATDLSNLGSKYRKASKAILDNIYFNFGSSVLKAESNDVLKELFFLLTSNPNLKVEIAGHTDNVGSHEFNMKLSEDRATSIKKELSSLGVADTQMIAKGYGETQPFATNDSEEEGRELNRRIEILVIPNSSR